MGEHLHYTVTWGDTLDSIAKRFSIDKNTLLTINQIEAIQIGLILTIPQESHRKVEVKNINLKLIDYLMRHKEKQHLFNFYQYQKSHRN